MLIVEPHVKHVELNVEHVELNVEHVGLYEKDVKFKLTCKTLG